jgi:hypothetical protein
MRPDEFAGVDLSALLDAPPLGECGRCHRKTWAPSEVGQEDRMTQPDGYPCGGRIEAVSRG